MIQSCTEEAAAGPLLTDVLHEVPRLLDFLYPHTAAVLAVNKAWREYSHQQPANISLWDGNDICQLTRGRCKRPQLQGLSLQSVKHSRPDHVTSLMRLPYLLSASWPQLRSLNLSDCSLGDEDIVSFSQGNWPLLETLDLSKNGLENNNIEQLTCADWPLLHELNLLHNELTTEVILILVQSNWSFQALYLDQLGFDEDLGIVPCKQMVEAQWVNLRRLHLIDCCLNDDGLSMLLTASWNNLQHLCLDDNHLESSSMMLLSEGCWPYLTSLSLRNNHISSAGMTALVKGAWPLLEALNVENNNIGATGCVALSRSTWQNLHFLNISENPLGNTGVDHLMKADWPLSTSLCMQAIGLKEDCKVLANSNWSELTRPHLGQSFDFTFDEVAPRLERLDLSDNFVYSSGTYPMGYHGWGILKRLCLSRTEGTYTDERPPTAVCTMLECLDLSSCGLVNVDGEGHISMKLAVEIC